MTAPSSSSALSIKTLLWPTLARVLLALALVVACFFSRVLFEGGPLERISIFLYLPLLGPPMVLGDWITTGIARFIPGMLHCYSPLPPMVGPTRCSPSGDATEYVTYALLFVWLYLISCLIVLLINAIPRRKHAV